MRDASTLTEFKMLLNSPSNEADINANDDNTSDAENNNKSERYVWCNISRKCAENVHFHSQRASRN